MRRRLAPAAVMTLVLALATSTASCGPNTGVNTQVMVVIDADPGIQSAAVLLVVAVYGGERGTQQADLALAQESYFPASPRVSWPRLVALAPLDRDASHVYRVEARAYDVTDATGATPIATVRAISGYVPDQTVVLRMRLQDSCIGIECTDLDSSCDRGRCVDAVIDETTLPPFSGDAGTREAGASDANMDAARDDTGTADSGVEDGSLDGGLPTDADVGPRDAGSDAAPACSAATCDDLVSCTEDFCDAAGCAHLPVDDRCDDGQDCTDDRCDLVMGCVHADNAASCDDGVFCNGLDQCSAGGCMLHAGEPCASCDESTESCGVCATVGDCPAATFGAWSACSFPDSCTLTGTRMRTRRAFGCVSLACEVMDTIESEACTRPSTAGAPCAASHCDPAGACAWATSCSETALAPRTCHDFECSLGACEDLAYEMPTTCNRSTDGAPCDDGDACTTPDECSLGLCSGTDRCDAGLPDASQPDASPPDAGPDAGPDASPPDAGPHDAGPDASEDDAGAGGPPDARTTFGPCTTTPSICDDGNPCTTDACMPGSTGADLNGCTHNAGPCADDGGGV